MPETTDPKNRAPIHPMQMELYKGNLKGQQTAIETHNIRAKDQFTRGLANWRQNAAVLKALGKPVPPPPTVPMLQSLDIEAFNATYWDWFYAEDDWQNTGERTVPDTTQFIKETPLPVPADAFKLGVDPDAKPQPTDPISQVDQSTTGRWNIAAGDRTPKGTLLSEAFPNLVGKYGNLKRMTTMRSFGGVPVHFWQAASNDSQSIAIWQRAVDKLNRVPDEDEESWEM